MPIAIETFVNRWEGATGTEQANSQLFLSELCHALRLEAPQPASSNAEDNSYVFERHIHQTEPDGSMRPRRIDLYRRGCFVLESKKVQAGDHTKGYTTVMREAFFQAQRYVQALPADEGRPPFIVIVDVGRTIDLYAEFTRTGGNYVAYPDPSNYRIRLADLRQPEVQERLRALWLDPDALDSSRYAAKVTREISAQLATLARSLERDGYDVGRVSTFLMRSLFTMFAEDTGLIPHGKYTGLLERLQEQPELFSDSMQALWDVMNRGGYEGQIMAKIPRFNGGLFRGIDPIPLTADQIGMLLASARHDWTEVEPAIFGTLLERALDPRERHKLGAHYTPRAYVERLVLPTVIEPLREEWNNIQVAALADYEAGRAEPARKTLRAFHYRLCETRILDPACGSGNFLYVAMEHLKRLEGEVLQVLADLSEGQIGFDTEGLTVDPHQFLGLEINPRAVAIAEMVLWIGYLQWHYRLYQRLDNLPEPILRDFKNIEHRDALIEYDDREPVTDEHGEPVTIWDGISMKVSPTTGELIPDETGRATVYRYHNPRRAEWPEAEYIVGNPPFIGASTMRRSLGDGYVDAVRQVFKGVVPDSADFVMYWWHLAAETVRHGQARRFGFITTNSLRQTFNRRVLEPHLGDTKKPLSLAFAVPDHPWVDGNNGAAVRIAMTVGLAGEQPGQLRQVTREVSNEDREAREVQLSQRDGKVFADLTIGADVAGTASLMANGGLAIKGLELGSQGFLIDRERAESILAEKPELERYLKPYMNGRDLTIGPPTRYVIDFHGLDEAQARESAPFLYQWLIDGVKPERQVNRESRTSSKWWLFRRSGADMRRAVAGLDRYIATTRTSKHRIFQFQPSSVVAESKIVVIAIDDSWALGILASRIHTLFSGRAGGWLGVGNDSTYNHLDCFGKFPFPDVIGDGEAIARLAEEIDQHRKRQQAEHDALTLTGMYNVLEKLRAGDELTAKDKTIRQQGLVSVLRELHDELDRAVFEAYGWTDLADRLVGRPGATTPLPDKPADQAEAEEALRTRLVDLNARRAAEESRGHVHWLRPDFQAPEAVQGEIPTGEASETPAVEAPAAAAGKRVFPTSMVERVQAVRDDLAEGPSTVEALAERYKRKPRQRITETLQAVAIAGMAYEEDGVWRLR